MKWYGVGKNLEKPQDHTVGDFVKKWSVVESSVRDSSGVDDTRVDFIGILAVIAEIGKLASATIGKLHKLRQFRNKVVHDPDSIGQKELGQSLKDLSAVKKEIATKLK